MTDAELAAVLFHTSNHAFRAEMLLKRAKIPCKLIPVPRHLSSDCGVCARVPECWWDNPSVLTWFAAAPAGRREAGGEPRVQRLLRALHDALEPGD